MTSCTAVDAPWNDIQLYKHILEYAEVTPRVAGSALKALKRHLWYITEEMVPLALFSKKVPSQEKEALARKLLSVKPEESMVSPSKMYGRGFGKPKFPEHIRTPCWLN